jgi:predicted SnoaL-like aldol condensation-catalyzing enzyme
MEKISFKLFLLLALCAIGFMANAQTKRNVRQEEANKKLVTTFYQGLIGDKNIGVIDKYLDKSFVTHNPDMPDGSDGLKKAFSADFANAPKIKVDFRHIAANGDFVFLHMKMKNPADKYEAVADIFKVKNNKIVELWDVIQEVPEKSENPHPMFDSVQVYTPVKRNVKQEEANKKLVLTFYQKLFGDKDVSAIDTFLSKDYIQHNPAVADGSAALKTAVKQWFKGARKEKVDVQHLAADGDLVFLHIKKTRIPEETRAIVDIFRVSNNKIVEHWDVIQEVPKASVSKHPMF